MGEQRELLFDQVDIPGPEEIADKTDTISDDWLLQGQRLTGALQYPSTIVPLFVAALAVMLIILEQLWLPARVLWIVTIAMMATAAGSFLWFYLLRYE